jgi:hypothetical protein
MFRTTAPPLTFQRRRRRRTTTEKEIVIHGTVRWSMIANSKTDAFVVAEPTIGFVFCATGTGRMHHSGDDEL